MLHPRSESSQGISFGLQADLLVRVPTLKKRRVHLCLKVLIVGQVLRAHNVGRYIKGNTVSEGVAETFKIRKPRIALNKVSLIPDTPR
jgi:hypothetical protein